MKYFYSEYEFLDKRVFSDNVWVVYVNTICPWFPLFKDFTHRCQKTENVISETYHVLAYGFLSNMHKEKDPNEKVPI